MTKQKVEAVMSENIPKLMLDTTDPIKENQAK